MIRAPTGSERISYRPQRLISGALVIIAAAGWTLAGCGEDTAPSAPTDTASAADAPTVDENGLPILDASQLTRLHARVDIDRMKKTMDHLASDAMGGRIPGSHGSQLAREYIRDEMKAMGLEPLGHKGGYFHTVALGPTKSAHMLTKDGKVVPHAVTEGTNIVGLLRGANPKKADEYIVLTGHYDHLGVTKDGAIYNGAFDDAGGVVVALEVLRALIADEKKPERSIVVVITDGEEGGLRGAEGWLADPTVPLDKIVMAMSADPFGRGLLPDYHGIWVSGADRSPTLGTFVRGIAKAYFKTPTQFVHRDLIPVFASDQDKFHAKNIPALWLFNLGFKFYHTVDDKPATIDYAVMRDDAHDLLSLLVALTQTDQKFAWVGAKELVPQDVVDVRNIFVALNKSKVLVKADRDRIAEILVVVDAAIAAGSVKDVKEWDSTIVGAVVFLVYGLAADYPGQVPPAWPGK